MAVATATLSAEGQTRLRALLDAVYPPSVAEELTRRISARLDGATTRLKTRPAWSPSDVVLITYADAIRDGVRLR